MSSFQIGSHTVDGRLVNAEKVRKWADSAKQIQTSGNPPADSWEALAQRAEKDGALSEEDRKQIASLGKACWTHHKDLHKKFKESGYKDQAIKAQLADVHVFTTGHESVRKAVKLSQALAAIQATAGASFGPTGVVAAYVAASKFKDDSLEEKPVQQLVESLQAVRSGQSELIHQGNRIDGFHSEEVWPKMVKMLDEAIAKAKAGEPQEVNAQYYELTNRQIVAKLAEAAEAGCKVRVNVDAGRLVAFKGKHVVIDEVPDKLRAMLQLMNAKGDVAVSAYPVSEQLGDPGDLMHRKGLRVGNVFFLSGMNANEGSGENVDAGYSIEGPASAQLVKNFARDVKISSGVSKEQIYGEKPLAEFMAGDINMGPRGLIGLFDCLEGPGPAGSSLPRASTWEQLEQVAKSYGQNLSEYISVSPEEGKRLLAEGEELPLSGKAKEAFMQLLDRTMAATQTPTNLERLADISIPDTKAVGAAAVAIADQPVDRETLMITAIQEAEKFIYIPAFVMTATVAEMLIAKKEEMEAQGKTIDIRVLADPGVYPDGGTPNQAGIERLEDGGISCRWANLTRSGWHDRKIHAKEIVTDKGEFFGSTNFSRKGLQENWEHSAYVRFDESDPEAVRERDEAQGEFLELWENESFELNSLERGKRLKSRDRDAKDFPELVDESRYGTIRDVISAIEAGEKDTGKWTEEQAKDPATAARVQQFVDQGYDSGDAILMAVKEKLGEKEFYAALEQLPARQELRKLR